MPNDLSQLRQIFDANRMRWIEEGHEGKWAVVGGADAHGFYDSYEKAYLAAAETFGDATFLLQQVLPEDRIESVQHVSWA